MNNLNKTEAREFALRFLFHLQLQQFEALRNELLEAQDSEQLEDLLADFNETIEINLNNPALKNHALRLIEGILKNYGDLNEIISSKTKNWKVDRIARVDLTLLLLGVYELKYIQETPMKVVIDEAVKMAKKYGSEHSGSFINGVLDKVAHDQEK